MVFFKHQAHQAKIHLFLPKCAQSFWTNMTLAQETIIDFLFQIRICTRIRAVAQCNGFTKRAGNHMFHSQPLMEIYFRVPKSHEGVLQAPLASLLCQNGVGNQTRCRYGYSCSRSNCYFTHPEGRSIDPHGSTPVLPDGYVPALHQSMLHGRSSKRPLVHPQVLKVAKVMNLFTIRIRFHYSPCLVVIPRVHLFLFFWSYGPIELNASLFAEISRFVFLFPLPVDIKYEHDACDNAFLWIGLVFWTNMVFPDAWNEH